MLEVTTSYLQGKYGVEIRIESVNKDNSRSWVRISHGLNKLVTDLSNKKYDVNEQETSETKTETFHYLLFRWFGRRVVAEGLSTLPGFAGASQGSPLRVAFGVPLGMGGDLSRADTYVSSAVSLP